MIWAIFASAVICLLHFFSEEIHIKSVLLRHHLISLAAGVSITYIFLQLIPDFFDGVYLFGNYMVIFLLVGFVMFHLIEKFIYQHAERKRLHKDLKEAHSAAIFIYYFIIGIVLVTFFGISSYEGILFTIPILMHTLVSNISLRHLHSQVKQIAPVKIFISSSTLFGTLFYFIWDIPLFVNYALIGSVAGIILYIVVRDAIPYEKEGKPVYFFIGVLVYSFLIAITWWFM